tara:strand:+ start:421410 stop:421652 length:243 start_codon:yes stop_codon:yes gene_type:complete
MASTESIQKRVVNTKRHTVGYLLRGGKRVTRTQAYNMARRNQIRNVRAVNGPNGRYIQSINGARNLYDLPITIESGSRRS